MDKPKPYSEEWWDQVYSLKIRISGRVTETVNRMTEGIDPEIDREVRTMLTEEYRFWRN